MRPELLGRSIPISDTGARWLALTGLAGTALLAVVLGWAINGNPDYAGSSSALSLLAADDTENAGLIRAGLTAFAVLLLPTGFAAYRLQRRTRPALGVCVLFAITGIATAVAASLSATSSRTFLGLDEGYWHAVAASIAGGAGLGVVALQTFAVRRERAWRGFYRFSLILIAGALFSGALSAADIWPAMVGVYERLFLAGGMAWLMLLTVKLFRQRRPRPGAWFRHCPAAPAPPPPAAQRRRQTPRR